MDPLSREAPGKVDVVGVAAEVPIGERSHLGGRGPPGKVWLWRGGGGGEFVVVGQEETFCGRNFNGFSNYTYTLKFAPGVKRLWGGPFCPAFC